MHVAAKVGFLPWVRDAEAFDLEAYQHYEQVQHGDLNWVLPGKLLALCWSHRCVQSNPRPALLPPPPLAPSRPALRAHGCSSQVLCIVDVLVYGQL